MTTQTSSTGMPSLPKIKGGEEVYNMIMKEIEPDLTTENLPNNEKKYEGETESQTVARAQRYQDAFLEYTNQYAEYKKQQDDEVRSYGRNIMKATENTFVAEDESAMSDLESAISNS